MRDSLKRAALALLLFVVALGVAEWTVWTAAVRSRHSLSDQAQCDAAGDQYRVVAARPITQLPPQEPVTKLEEMEYRVASEERSDQFAARGAALHTYAEACNLGAAAQDSSP